MELCTSKAVSNPSLSVAGRRLLCANPESLVGFGTSLHLRRVSVSRGLHSRSSQRANFVPRATFSEESSGGGSRFGAERDERDGAITVEDVKPVEKNVYGENFIQDVTKEDSGVDEQTQTMEFLENFKLDTENTYQYLLYGGGAIVALYLASALIGAIDSIPLFPKLMEVVGLGYTFWFTTRFLLFKKNREELVSKVEEIKKQVLGPDED